MHSSKGSLIRFLAISFVVLFGWLGVLAATGAGSLGGSTYARANLGPANDLFGSWVLSPTNAILTPSPVPPAITRVPPTVPVTDTIIPSVPWDTFYLKAGSVLRDPSTGAYRMYYESARVITTTSAGVVVSESGIGIAFSLDGINWTKSVTSAPIFAAQGKPTISTCPGDIASAWDSAYVGSPRVVFDGQRYRMFYVGNNVGRQFTGNNTDADNFGASVGVAESADGINWCRGGRNSPVLTPTGLAWDSLFVEPTGVRIENGLLKMYYHGTDSVSGLYRTGLATTATGTVFATTVTGLITFTKNINNPIKVAGVSDRVKGAHAIRVGGNLLLYFVSNVSGTDLIYQAYATDETNFIRDPSNNLISLQPGAPNAIAGQVDVGGVIVREPGFLRTAISAEIYFTGISSLTLNQNAFRAISPDPATIPTPTPTITPGAITPVIVPTSSAILPSPTPGLPALPPPVPNAGPGAFQTATPGDGNYPAFYAVWRRVDEPVRAGFANRSWIYGGLPYGFRFLRERYEEGSRLVLYHDKARMEAFGNGGVTNGLLAKELISGLMQVGDNKFEVRTPANEAIAGDAIELNPNNPAYYSLFNVASLNNDKRIANRSGQPAIETINRDGQIGADIATGNYGVSFSYYEPILGHNIANVFWDFMNQSGLVLRESGYANEAVIDWLAVVGLPLTEPYWTKAVVGGRQTDVLVQAFERRVLTYTPSNPEAFRVEMGNVGRHYFRWRYNLSF